MLPRNSLMALLVLSVWLITAPGLQAREKSNGVISFYKKHISRIDGDRCPMYPSCSQYAAEAFAKHGFLMGWIMTCDRLVRCGRDETDLAQKLETRDRTFTYDPVSANDFWWFNEKKND